MLFTTLLVSGLLVQAVQIPLFQSNGEHEDITTLSAESIEIKFESPEDIIERIDESNQSTNKEDKWKCDIRSWVRAPDLSPSSIIPAETRLSANGSGCNQIERWEVGLRFKERAIARLKSKSISEDEFPIRPKYPSFNESCHQRFDYNDIYFVGGGSPLDPWDEYNNQMKEYSDALKNQSLWDVHGSERIVFDITQELSYTPLSNDNINEIRSFFVQVPNTNFPPMLRYDYGLMFGSNTDHILNTETVMEYYHLIHLHNGTVLDIPAGKAGFIPQVGSVVTTASNTKQEQHEWTVNIDLDSEREEPGEGDEGDDMFRRRRYGSNAPGCDKGNWADFHLQVTSNFTEVVQGQNVTLNFTLTRTGNGTEYPAFLHVQSGTSRNVTWAYNFISTEDEYDTLLGLDEERGGPRRRSKGKNRNLLPDFMPPIHMLQIPSERELEEIRKQSQMNYGYSVMSDRSILEYGQSRFDIEKDMELGEEEYTFSLEITIPEYQFPSFETTSEKYQSILEFRLSTVFLCEPIDAWGPSSTASWFSSDDEEKLAMDKLDDEWSEYTLPTKKDEKKIRNGRHLSHTGSIPLNLIISPPTSGGVDSSKTEPIHYLDSNALAPTIYISEEEISKSEKSFGKLGKIKPESGNQLRKSRYGSESNGYHDWRPGNVGGRSLHAAKLWQSKERKSKD